MKSTYRIILLVVLLLPACTASAQWQSISTVFPSFTPPTFFGGSMTYKSGKLWVGINQELRYSTNDGISFTKSSLNLQPNEQISDIDFFDAFNGLVCASSQRVYQTQDGGLTWRVLTRPPGDAKSAKYIRSAQEIAICCERPSQIAVTSNGGATWNINNNLFAYLSVIYLQTTTTGSVYTMVSRIDSSEIILSRDFGLSWQSTGAAFDEDCYTFCIDPCDSSSIYIMNEELRISTDDNVDCIASKNGGKTWAKNTIGIGNTFACGSLISPTHLMLYTQTLHNGIMRSTDGGRVWENINGPDGLTDSRMLAFKSPDEIFAMDETGTIWFTANSGGIPHTAPPKGGAILSEQSLFSGDSILPCDSIRLSVHIISGGCYLPSVVSEQILGNAASDYSITTHPATQLSGKDSLVISFVPTTTGDRNALYRLTLDNGTVLDLPLAGNGHLPLPLTLAGIPLITVDTIGGGAVIPITVTGLDKPHTVQMSISYDTKNLIYLGTSSVAGTALDLLPIANTGIAKIQIPASELRLDTVSAFSHFRVFVDSIKLSGVVFDSLRVTDPEALCRYAVAQPSLFQTDIATLNNCGVVTLSNYLRYQKVAGFSVVPNPSKGTVTISTTLPVGDVTISVVDPLGAVHYSKPVSFSQSKTTSLDLNDLGSGVYYIRITSSQLNRVIPIVIQH